MRFLGKKTTGEQNILAKPFDKLLIRETKQSAMHQQFFLVPFVCYERLYISLHCLFFSKCQGSSFCRLYRADGRQIKQGT